MKRDKYIDNIDVEEALQKFLSKIDFKREIEKKAPWDSLDRITGDLISANFSSPNYNAAAMDGIAVLSKKTINARENSPLILKEKTDFLYVNTGNPLPKEYDSVIMIEDVVELDKGEVEIISPARPWQHVRPVGEDIIKGEPVLFANHKIRPQDIGALLSAGLMEIPIYKKPKVGIIPTGTEIVEDSKELSYGKIMDSNSRMFAAMVEKWGGEASRFSPTEDNYHKLSETIKKAVQENDIVVINAGSSTGTKDFTASIIGDMGEVLSHGVALKPGKPTILAVVQGKPVLGIPGYPVSAFISAETFLKPLIENYLLQKKQNRSKIKAVLSRSIPSSLKHREIVRVTLGFIDGKLIATHLSRGAGVSMSLVKADALLEIPRNYEGYQKGEEVEVTLLRPLEEIGEYLISIGSHDIVMDLIADEVNLSSTHTGSMGGVTALKKCQTHIAPVHILNEQNGVYNEFLLDKYFDDETVLIRGVEREQGLIVPKGNPKNIFEISDLSKDNIVFINRQRGAGTRILLDYLLKKDEIRSSEISGYEREATTHMACATAVKSGSADVALGIKAAAQVMDLDFIPITFENYDFLVKKETLSDERMKSFLNFIRSQRFEDKIKNLGGYNARETGKLIFKGDIS
ncbi:molybdopterin biosynthesis protein [uncultured Ilyobacter sp.]|uniref:molybdopterin biosynthesis protein n=1 Tax=uncultured Ilyobacter sp. TaxID=544433 RepID=UPI002AA811EB|nr:molybdopterin biosynthesis protein [uncultured Ilyobacter sp.]